VTEADVQNALSTVKAGVAKPGSVPGQVMLDSVLALEKQKLAVRGDWAVPCCSPPG
jgi:hypothetical protein